MNATLSLLSPASPLIQLLSLFYLVPPHLSSFQTLDKVPDYVADVTPYFFVLILIEIITRWIQGLPSLRLNDSIGSITAGMFMLMLNLVVLQGVELVGFVWVYENYRVYSLPWDSAVTWWLAFLGLDFGYYWFHRMAHEVNLFWSAHQVHHSSEEYNLTTALRQSTFQRFTSMWFYLPLALFMPPTHFLVHKEFNLLYQFWIHTECIGTLGPLEYILNTPSHHRVHHGRNRYCIDKNYAGVLIIWDRMFGTFEKERDTKIHYGLVHNIKSFNPVWVQIHHYKYLMGKLWSGENLFECISILFKGPGWSPGKPRLGDPHDVPEVPSDVTTYNPPVPLWVNLYIFLNFALLIVISVLLEKMKSDLPYMTAVCAVLVFLYSLTCIGMIYDHHPLAPFCEIVKLLIIIALGFYKGFHLSESLVVQGLMVSVVMSTIIWFIVLFKQVKMKRD